MYELERFDIQLLDLLAKAGGRLHFNKICKLANRPKKTVWSHLRRLVEGGLVEREEHGRGRKTLYQITETGLRELVARRIILSLHQGPFLLFEGPGPVHVTFTLTMPPTGFANIVIYLQRVLAEKLYELLGGEETVSCLKRGIEIPHKYEAEASRIANTLTVALLSALKVKEAPVLVWVEGEYVTFDENSFPRDLALKFRKMLSEPQGVRLLLTTIMMYAKLQEGGEEPERVLGELLREFGIKSETAEAVISALKLLKNA